MMNISIVLFQLVSLFILIAIPALIGVYVYRDASQRGMNVALWTLVAVFGPSFIGLIIYLLVRTSYADLECPACANPVTEQYVVCPKCGAKLKSSCQSCGFPTEPDWMVCPRCTSPLSEQNHDCSLPIRKKDTALGKVFLTIILMIFLLIVLAISGLTTFSVVSSTSVTSYSVEDYGQNQEVAAWIEECDKDPSKTYALRYQKEYGDQKETHYLLYRPTVGQMHSRDSGLSSGLFGSDLKVRFSESFNPVPAKDNLTYISSYSNVSAGLKVYVNDKKVKCEITEVDYNPTPSI